MMGLPRRLQVLEEVLHEHCPRSADRLSLEEYEALLAGRKHLTTADFGSAHLTR